jgi:hypothetical protein
MSDLIEKVARAMWDHPHTIHTKAKAAIAVVLREVDAWEAAGATIEGRSNVAQWLASENGINLYE